MLLREVAKGLEGLTLGLQERGVLALWVTNRERHRRFIDAELLPAWGLRHVATWHWLKVTDDGQLVSPLVLLHAAT